MAQRQFRTDDTDQWSDRYGDGSDGAFSTSGNATDAPIDAACTGTAGATSLSATNASFAADQIILIHQTRGSGAGVWELNRIASYTAGTITTAYDLMNTYGSGAQVLVLEQHSSVDINVGHTITAKAWDGSVGGILAYLCTGTITVAGVLNADEKGFRNGVNQSSSGATQGEGTAGAGSTSTSANGSGGGGGGREDPDAGGGGGGGGNGAAGSDGSNAVNATNKGSGGLSVGSADLTSMDLGGGGGGGGSRNGAGGDVNHDGKDGGAIVVLIGKNITVTGTITLDGGTQSTSSTNDLGAGAGGGGGSALFKGQIVDLGSSKVGAAAGNGGGDGGDGGAGGNGAVGRIHADYSESISGTTSPTLDSSEDSILADFAPRTMLF